MGRIIRVTSLAAAAIVPSSAVAVVGSPGLSPTPFTKATGTPGGVVNMKVNWAPSLFAPETAQDHHELVLTDLDGGVGGTAQAGPKDGTTTILVTDGRRYSVKVLGCQMGAPCPPASSSESIRETRVDATPPSGTFKINGGAVATNSTNVTLALSASDPLVGGVPGTSSGITEFEVDSDGDGIFPCIGFLGNFDLSGCARTFAPSVPFALSSGDGVKTIGMRFGDGAREMPVPCTGPFCVTFFGNPIQGNASNVSSTSIILDTVKPLAIPTQDRFNVERGGSATFDAAVSIEPSAGTSSGVDLTQSTWDFKDGTAPVTGGKVIHTFARVGTFVGELRVKDRAGNQSDVRQFSMTVTAPPGEATSGSGTVGVVSGQGSTFSISRVQVKARYVRSRLIGKLALGGVSTQAGTIRATLRPKSGGRVLTRPAKIGAGPFNALLTLPSTMLPGIYQVVVTGPGGGATSTLTLTPPREGVLRKATLTRRGGGPLARFTFAALPAPSLRNRVTVAWFQGGRIIAKSKVGAGRTISVPLPGGVSVKGKVRAELRTVARVVGSITG